jgi:hypothetical protein
MPGPSTWHASTWEPVPRWHPAYWVGYRWRKDAGYGQPYEPAWEYQTNRQRARQHLAVAFGDGDLGSKHHVSQQ